MALVGGWLLQMGKRRDYYSQKYMKRSRRSTSQKCQGRWGAGQDNGAPQQCPGRATLANSSWYCISLKLGQDNGSGEMQYCGVAEGRRSARHCTPTAVSKTPELKSRLTTDEQRKKNDRKLKTIKIKQKNFVGSFFLSFLF